MSDYAASAANTAPSVPGGVVVESLEPGGAAEKAGLKAGDVLLSWERAANLPANPEPASGEFRTPFDLRETEIEQAPRGSLKICVVREERSFEVEIPPGDWKAKTRPELSDHDRADYELAVQKLDGETPEAAIGLFENLASGAAKQEDFTLAAWFISRVADGLASKMKWDLANRLSAKALNTVREPGVSAQLQIALGGALEKQDRPEEAHRAYEESLCLLGGPNAWSLAVAASLNNLGLAAIDRGDLEAAQAFHSRALEIRERFAPGGLSVAASLNNLGNVAAYSGDLEVAETFYRRALEIRENLAPGGLDVAMVLNNLAVVTQDRGDLLASEAFHRRALEIFEKLAPGGFYVAGSLNNLGAVAKDRGDLEAAETFQRRALEIYEKLAAGSLSMAASLNNLGVLAKDRGDLEAAEAFYRRALEIYEKLAPGSLGVAIDLNNLGNVSLDRGDLKLAEVFYRRALEIYEKLAPGSLDVAMSYNNLGVVAKELGNLEAAEAYNRRSLEIKEKLAPGSLAAAMSLNNLGNVALGRGELKAADVFYRRALEIYEKLAPGSKNAAESAYFLAKVLRDEGEPQEALLYFERAAKAVESQMERLGGSEETRAAFRASYLDCYRDYIDLLLRQGQRKEAFHLLERSRARQLLAMLAERDLLFGADVPVEMDRQRRMLNAEQRKALEAMGELSIGDEEKIRGLRLGLEEIQGKQAELQKAIKETSPHLAALQYPAPLDAVQAQSLLEPGTVLLTWSVGRERTHLFVLTRAKLETAEIKIGREALALKVRRLRDQITEGEALTAAGDLSKLLIGPARKTLAKAERLLIIPDGPLHGLPFATLDDPVKEGAFLVERFPITTVVSMTVYGEIKKQEKPAGERANPSLVAFGDPSYPPGLLGDGKSPDISPALRTAMKGGLRLGPLPSTRVEVEAIGRLYHGEASLRLGSEATEESAKTLGKVPSVIHFACHGYVNERFPLESGLVLSIPEKFEEGKENGFLQAWEIFEKLRIDADLVTLSACETALGKEMGGEGLIGLTRAFQYAGARSVLSSLWNVADESTALLMTRFYVYLREGKPKAEALRLAQLDLIGSGSGKPPKSVSSSSPAPRLSGSPARSFSHPFYWAAFVLNGDWR